MEVRHSQLDESATYYQFSIFPPFPAIKKKSKFQIFSLFDSFTTFCLQVVRKVCEVKCLSGNT